ncbi:AraC family transcriptional regulator [Lentzea sp. NPDC058450]|uniref:AraC family transcriptional regulator n=1 Tax=Lentzea sp. NPDC058450 TaxID=3346505 RepID=UPI00365320E3
MDVLTDVIATMRVGRAKFTRSRWAGSWGHRFGPYPGAGFHVVVRGSCWLITRSSAPVRLDAGDVVFLPHGAEHGLSDHPDRTVAELPPARDEDHAPDDPDAHTHLVCGAYRLDRGQAHPFLRALPEVVHLRARPGRHPALRAAVDLIGADVVEREPGAGAALPALLDLLLVYLLRAWLEEESLRVPGAGWCAAFTDPVVATALRHMHRTPAHGWTVGELAERVDMSRTAFARRFTTLVGQSPIAYLTWWRLSAGARMLRDGDETLAAVARQVGYTSEFAFAAAFKREFGAAPGRFRRASGP